MNKQIRIDQTKSKNQLISSIGYLVQPLLRFKLPALGAIAVFCTGCAMCCGPYDYHYPTHGGISQRSDPVWGRLGSLFSDPGPFGGPSADYNLTPNDGRKPDNSNFDDELDELEPIDEDPESSLNPPENMLENHSPDNGDVLPPPANDRPSPDDESAIRRLRNQSRRGTNRWR